MSPLWHHAIAYALTGESLELGEQDAPAVRQLVADLADRGWTADRIRQVAVAEAGVRRWPFPLPDAVRSGLGAAQLHAAIGATRRALGLEAVDVRTPTRRVQLDADERRLQADVPPHY